MKKKFVWNPARFFFHDTGTEKIEALAKEGWSVEKLQLGGLLFQLIEDKPKEVQYQLEFQSIQHIDADIKDEKAGWTLVDAQDYMQVFEGPPEAPPMVVSRKQLLDLLHQEGRMLGKYTIMSCFFSLLLLLVHMNIHWPPLQLIVLGGLIMVSIAFILMLALYMINKYRRYNLKNTSSFRHD